MSRGSQLGMMVKLTCYSSTTSYNFLISTQILESKLPSYFQFVSLLIFMFTEIRGILAI